MENPSIDFLLLNEEAEGHVYADICISLQTMEGSLRKALSGKIKSDWLVGKTFYSLRCALFRLGLRS